MSTTDVASGSQADRRNPDPFMTTKASRPSTWAYGCSSRRGMAWGLTLQRVLCEPAMPSVSALPAPLRSSGIARWGSWRKHVAASAPFGLPAAAKWHQPVKHQTHGQHPPPRCTGQCPRNADLPRALTSAHHAVPRSTLRPESRRRSCPPAGRLAEDAFCGPPGEVTEQAIGSNWPPPRSRGSRKPATQGNHSVRQ